MNKFFANKAMLFMGLLTVALFTLSGCNVEKRSEKIANKSYIVKIAQMKFTPSNLTVNKGDTVVWVNDDYVQHDITDFKGKTWSSGPLDKGMKWSKVITKDEDYFCSIHVVMKGSVHIKE